MNGDKQYDDEKKGYLWHENDSVIDRKGSFVINGEKRYRFVAFKHRQN